MYTATVLACLAFALFGTSRATTLGEHSSSGGFCYNSGKECGPAHWPGVCETGKRQSPIDLPGKSAWDPVSRTVKLNLKAYKGALFRLQNNGHSVQFDFANQGPSTQNLSFPDPILAGVERKYRFAAGHFHWGGSDKEVGSEHFIDGKPAALELHLVHYLAEYPSMTDAVNSGDESALSVVGVLFNVSTTKTFVNKFYNIVTGKDASDGAGTFGPIARNLKNVSTADHDTSKWFTVNEALDLTAFLDDSARAGMYTYKGSLTTPGCNEQVNWFVLRKVETKSHQILEAFRSDIKDAEGEVLKENHRPLQNLEGRTINYVGVINTAN